MIVVAPLRLLPFPPKTTTTSSKPRFGYFVLLNKEVRWDFWPFASFYRNGKYRTTRSYNRQKQIFATSFGFGIYIYIDKETYFYRSTFILCFFLFTLYSNTEIHAESVEATPLKQHFGRKFANDSYIYIGNRTYLRFSITVLHFHRALNIRHTRANKLLHA